MKLLKKLLPFATIASVAGIIVPTIVSCKSEKTPVKEYRYTNDSDERINITSSDKFVLNQALVIEYEITDDNYEIDVSASSYIKIGQQTIYLSDCAHDYDSNSGIITILAANVNNKTIVVNLKTVAKGQVDESFTFDVATFDELEAPEQREGTPETSLVTSEYLTDIIALKFRLAYDMVYSMLKTTAFTPITASDYETINVNIRNIQPENWKMSFDLELIPPASGSTKSYSRLVVTNFTYVVSYAYLSVGGQPKWDGWAIEPLALWLNNESLDSATWYLKSDGTWSAQLYASATAETPIMEYSSQSSIDELETFVTTNIATNFDLSYQSYYWHENRPSI